MSFSRSTDCFYPDGQYGFVLGSHDHVKPESKSTQPEKAGIFHEDDDEDVWVLGEH